MVTPYIFHLCIPPLEDKMDQRNNTQVIDKFDDFPQVSQELIDVLDRIFPDRCPHVSDIERLIWVKVGNRQVVEFLRAKRDEQLEPYDR